MALEKFPGQINPHLITDARQELEHINQLFWQNAGVQQKITAIIEQFATCLLKGGKILSCGNGGSMCDAIHFAEELTGRFKDERPPCAAIAISDPGHLSCTANDYGYSAVFARYIQALGRPGDCLLAISTSGNSENVLLAVEKAQKIGMTIVALLGKDGGKLKDQSAFSLVVPSVFTSHIQETHIQLIHLFIAGIEQLLFFPQK